MNSGNHVMLLGDLLPSVLQQSGRYPSRPLEARYKHIIFQPAFDIQELAM